MMTGWLHEDLKQHRAMLSRLEAECIPAIETAMAQNGTAQAPSFHSHTAGLMKLKFTVFCFVLAAIALVMVERLFEFNDRISRLEREGSAQRQFNYWVTTNLQSK